MSLRYKHTSAAKKQVADIVARVMPTTTMNGMPSTPRVPEREIDPDWSEEKVDRFIRAANFPPHPAPTASLPNGDRFYIETPQQFARLRKRQRENEESPNKNGVAEATKSGYAADTHFYSNVGGSIVKIVSRSADEPVKVREASSMLAVPGAAVAGARKKLRMNEPVIGLNAERYCQKALASTWIGVEGPYVKKFERLLARIAGCEQACAVQSGTAALYGALKALGVENKEHHVIVPTYTCSACADAVVHAGGEPIAVDCELDTFGLSFDAVKACLDDDTKVVGIVMAPCYGIPCRDYHKIATLCAERKVFICEDNCEAFGASMRASENSDKLVPVGSCGSMSVISVRSEKMVGVGEGGAVMSRDGSLVNQARWWCARAPTRGVGLWRVYEHDAIGQNYRLPEMLAAVGLASAEALPANIDRKTRIHELYAEGFAGSGLRLQHPDPRDKPVWWLNAVMLPSDCGFTAEQLGLGIMEDHPEIEVRPAFFPLHTMAPFKAHGRPCPNAEEVYQRLFCLPSSAQLEDADIRHIVASVLAQVKKQSASA